MLSIAARKSVTTAAVFALCSAAHAEENYWTNGNGTNRWAEAGNWSLGRVPNSTDHAIIAWGPNSTSVIVDTFCQTGSFTNANNQTIISGNGYLRVWGTGHIAGGLFMYGTTPILETYGTTNLLGEIQLYKATFRTAPGANLIFEPNSTTTFVANGGGVNFEGGSVTNWGTWNVNSGSFGVGNFNDADPVTTIDNKISGRITLNANGGVFDPSAGNHNGGNSIFINRGVFEAIGGGNNPVEADIQYWVLDLGITRTRFNTGLDIKTPVNLDVNGRLDRGQWVAEDTSYLAFAGAGRSVTEIDDAASVYMHGPSATVYGIDQLTSIKGLLSIDGGKNLLMQPLAPLVMSGGMMRIGSGSSVTLWQSFTQTTGVIYRTVATAADMQSPALSVTGVANVHATAQVNFLDPSLPTINSLTKIVSAQQGIGGAFAGVSMNGPVNTFPRAHYTSNDAYIRVGPACEGDLNGDGAVNTGDLVMFLGQFGSQRPAMFDGADFNGDTVVSTPDLTMFLGRFGIVCL